MRKIGWFLSAVLFFCVLSLLSFTFSETRHSTPLSPGLKVFDGDTIEVSLDGERTRLRYLLIDTPELHHPSRPPEELGEDALSLNIELLSRGPFRLEYDMEPTDRYGRKLVYIYVENGEEELFINEVLVRQGLALPMFIPPNRKHADRILLAFEEARDAGRGLWKAASGRLFTAAQAWSEAPYLAGSFITLCMTIEKAETTGKRILLREGRVAVTAYKGPETEGLLSLREGEKIRATGKLLLSFSGCELPVASDLQVTRLVY